MPRSRVQVTPDHNLALDLVRTTEAAAGKVQPLFDRYRAELMARSLRHW